MGENRYGLEPGRDTITISQRSTHDPHHACRRRGRNTRSDQGFPGAERALHRLVGAIGRASLCREPFDAVVSDYKMPGIDGIELLRAVRNGGSDIPFIIFTGKGREEVVVEAIG
ncbi:MAG: response regulator, partial [Methanoculleaceae archaeon]